MFIQEHPVLMWSLLIAVFFVISALHIIENKRLKNHLQGKHDDESIKHIVHFSWSRSIQFLSIIILFFIVVIVYDLKVRTLQNELLNIHNSQTIKALLKPDNSTKNVVTTKNTTSPVILKNPDGSSAEDTIEDIFNTDSTSPDANNLVDNLKTRYEELIVNYLLMHKCAKDGKDDFKVITTFLQKEIADIKAPERLRDDIITAAQGSYEELYSTTDCSSPAVESSSKQYNTYIASLSAKIGK